MRRRSGMSPQEEIDRLRLKVFREYTRQELMVDMLVGVIAFVVVFGIGFTLGYLHR